MTDPGIFFNPERFKSNTGGSSGAIKPGAVYEASVLSVASSATRLSSTNKTPTKGGQVSLKLLGNKTVHGGVRVCNQSPMNPLVSGDRVSVVFLDMQLREVIVLGRLDGQEDVFIPLTDTDGKGGSRPAFTGTLTGEKVSVTGSGTNALNVTNGITANTGQFTTINANSHSHSSDKRMKTRIKPITNALERIKRLAGVKYKRRTAVGSTEEFQTMDGYQYGLLAQDSAAVIPSAVIYNPDRDVENTHGWSDAYGIDYGTITPVLIEAIKELAERVEELENHQKPSSDVG